MLDITQARTKKNNGLKFKDKVVILDGFYENIIGEVIEKTVFGYIVRFDNGREEKEFMKSQLGVLYGSEEDYKFIPIGVDFDDW